MTYKTGTIGEFMQWTKSVVANPANATAAPKRWFDSEEMAAKALGASISPEALIKLLSPDNIELLRLIRTARPASLKDLAVLAHREESNLSRTLKKLHSAGIVIFERGAGRALAPRLFARRVTLDLDLLGSQGVVYRGRSAAKAAEKPSPAVPVKKSITSDYIICLEDGRKFKSLKRHLRTQYNLSPEEYRAKWGLPSDYPMVAPGYAKARAALAKEMGLGASRRRA
jgi:predicted transcriptional regulator